MKPSVPASADDPSQWLGATALVDPECPRLRLKAQSISQHGRTDRDKVLALYAAVKGIPFGKPIKSARMPAGSSQCAVASRCVSPTDQL